MRSFLATLAAALATLSAASPLTKRWETITKTLPLAFTPPYHFDSHSSSRVTQTTHTIASLTAYWPTPTTNPYPLIHSTTTGVWTTLHIKPSYDQLSSVKGGIDNQPTGPEWRKMMEIFDLARTFENAQEHGYNATEQIQIRKKKHRKGAVRAGATVGPDGILWG